MKGYNLWSYRPYKPVLGDVGDIYICRVAPSENMVHFEWLNTDDEVSVFAKKRDAEEFKLCGKTKGSEFDIKNLDAETDYEFFVETAGGQKSRIRLARTGKSIGTVVNYLHPDDECYAFSGRYLCSPSLVRHPDGFLLASMDLYEGSSPQNLTLIFRSDDEGETWHYVSELFPCFWGKLFIHGGELYMLACSTEYGDLLIGKSVDGGKTFSAPVCLLRGSGGKNGNNGVHRNPQNIITVGNRLYSSLEWGSWRNKEFFAPMVMSCNVDDDLLTPENWSFSEPHFPSPDDHEELYGMSKPIMTIEGTPALTPDGKLLNILRFSKGGHAASYEVDLKRPEAPLKFYRCLPYPCRASKFMIKYDEVSRRYYSIGADGVSEAHRNRLSLLSSSDLFTWRRDKILFDFTSCSPDEVGLQYVDFEIEGDDIIYLCRTALNSAHNYHDANYSTFHRIKNFRNI